MSGAVHPASHRRLVSFWTLLFGATGAPLLWLGQMMLGYLVSARLCYGGDHPEIAAAQPLRMTLIVFAAIAVAIALAAGVTSLNSWRTVKTEASGGSGKALETGEGRTRFLALWGMLSSVIFLLAILFNAIVTAWVPLCTR